MSELATGELDALHLVWTEQRGTLEESGRLEEFNQLLQREWSIETGILEGVYNLDRGTTEILIQKGIDAELIPRTPQTDPLTAAAMIRDHEAVLEGLFAFVKGERPLSVGYIKELHAALLRHQDSVRVMDQFGKIFEKKLEKGAYKVLPNSPTTPDGSIHEYCPPEHVTAEMERLVALHLEHARAGVSPEVESAWLHHAFTQIHPFEDGNGRVARALATLVFLKAGWFPLVITRDDKASYIDALEGADRGDLKPLISFVTSIQKRSLMKAFEIASKVKPIETIDEAVAAAAARLVTKGEIPPIAWERARGTAHRLLSIAGTELNQVAGKLQARIGEAAQNFQFQTATGNGKNWTAPIEVATRLSYIPNLSEHNTFAELTLRTAKTANLYVSFHGLGSRYRGLLAASAFLETDARSLTVLSDDFFQINYKEDENQAVARFQPWLDAAITKGLALWAAQL